MLRILVIEDEPRTARTLIQLLVECDPTIVVENCLESIEASVTWLKEHTVPDLIFMDIQLSDGLCFAIFNRCEVACPVIFTTAYDEYALQAFTVNSIDYLLKPVSREDLVRSLKKFEFLRQRYGGGIDPKTLDALMETMQQAKPQYKSRFVVKSGQGWITIFENQVAYFLSDRKLTFLVARDGRKHVVDESLEELETLLHPHEFFRVNRHCIASVGAIVAVQTFFNGGLKLELKPQAEEEILVSRKKAAAFKKWLDQ